MKRLFALLMVALIAVSLAACVPTPGDLSDLVDSAIDHAENKIEQNIDKNDTNLDIQIGDNDDDVDVDVDLDLDFDDDNTQETVTIDMGTLSQQVIVDDKGIKITVEDITYEEYYGPQISFLIENNSDKDISISSGMAIVNNVVFPNYFYADVNSGKKLYEDMHFYENDLKDLDITELGTVEFKISISEQETYDEILATDMIKLVLNDKVDLKREAKGEKIFSKEGITVYTEKCPKEDDDYYDYVTRFFVVNESNTDVTLRLEDVSVNGFMIDPYCSTSIPAGKMAYTNLYFYVSDLETNKIKEIEEVEFTIDIYNAKSYDDIVKSDAIKIKAD